jgi:hypothetical protein
LLADPAGEFAAAHDNVIRGVNMPSKADVAVGVAVPKLTQRCAGRVGEAAPLRIQSRQSFCA